MRLLLLKFSWYGMELYATVVLGHSPPSVGQLSLPFLSLMPRALELFNFGPRHFSLVLQSSPHASPTPFVLSLGDRRLSLMVLGCRSEELGPASLARCNGSLDATDFPPTILIMHVVPADELVIGSPEPR